MESRIVDIYEKKGGALEFVVEETFATNQDGRTVAVHARHDRGAQLQDMMDRTAYASLAVGDTLPELTMPPINRTTLALFAGASGDHNPVHIDMDFGEAAGMPDVFAHGMLVMAYLGRTLTNWMPQAGAGNSRCASGDHPCW